MNENALTTINATASIAIAKPSGKNYMVNCAGIETKLKRDTDFGVIPKTKQPTLFKSGAEKICMAYGLLQHYDIESKIEQFDGKAPFFYYLVKCSLVKIHNGTEYVWTTGYGSANTAEKRNGFNSPADAANGTIKMAQKRALVAAALAISGLSDAFTQDMENENFMQNAKVLVDSDNPDSPVTAQQIKRLYALGADAGLNAAEVKQKLAAQGITSTKQILQKDYNRVCDLISGDDKLSAEN